MNDQSLTGDTHDQPQQPASTPFGNPDGPAVPRSPQLETVLSLDEIMSSARLAERKAKICMRSDLEAEYLEALEQLGALVDDRGNVVSDGEQALTDQSRAIELNDTLRRLQDEMADAMRVVRFRAMPTDAWDAWSRSHHDEQGKVKDVDAFNEQIIAKTAIAPTLTVDQVRQLRSKISPVQFAELANTAYYACTTGGVDVPKSPSFSVAPKPTSSGRN